MFSIIVCVNNKNVIGKDNQLLYKLPSDLKHFKKITTNNVVIMGRKTFESLPIKPLPNRVNIVITRDKNFKADGVEVVHSIEDAIYLCSEFFSDKKCFIIGGGQIYQECIDKGYVHEIIVTHVDDDSDGDTYFPSNLDKNEWFLSHIFQSMKSEKDSHEFVIQIWHRF